METKPKTNEEELLTKVLSKATYMLMIAQSLDAINAKRKKPRQPSFMEANQILLSVAIAYFPFWLLNGHKRLA
jgi:hypothetical protein